MIGHEDEKSNNTDMARVNGSNTRILEKHSSQVHTSIKIDHKISILPHLESGFPYRYRSLLVVQAYYIN